MINETTPIRKDDTVRDIVLKDYRAADVFLKHGIKFCCGANIPLEQVCTSMELDASGIMQELEKATSTFQIGNDINFHDWEPSFIADFITHIHHKHSKNTFPLVKGFLDLFLEGHQAKYPELKELGDLLSKLIAEETLAMQDEEEIYFPYIKRISHAYSRREPYGDLLMRTLRKPLKVVGTRNESIKHLLNKIRLITSDYIAPEKACVTHKVTFFKLKEMDTDIRQHLYLENEVLIPKAMQIEKELLMLNTP